MDLIHAPARRDAPPGRAEQSTASSSAVETRPTHELRFSARFLHPGQSARPESDDAVVYARERDGDIINFAQSADGKKLLGQYTDGVRRIAAKLTRDLPKTDPQARRIKQRLAVFTDRLRQGAGTGSFFSTELGLLYGYGKHAFDRITAALDNPSAPERLLPGSCAAMPRYQARVARIASSDVKSAAINPFFVERRDCLFAIEFRSANVRGNALLSHLN